MHILHEQRPEQQEILIRAGSPANKSQTLASSKQSEARPSAKRLIADIHSKADMQRELYISISTTKSLQHP